MRLIDPITGAEYCKKTRTRFDNPKDARELTFCCYRGYQFLSRDRTREWFVNALEEARRAHGIAIWAYVLMPEHVHLLLHPRRCAKRLALVVGEAKEHVARLGVEYLREHAPEWISKITVYEGERERRRFWQPGSGYDRNVDSPRVMAAMIDYIHQNPVRRGLVERAVDWPWSSARWYAGWRNVPLAMDPLPADLFSDLARFGEFRSERR